MSSVRRNGSGVVIARVAAEGGYLLARNFHGFLRLPPMDFAGLKSASKAPQAQETGLQAHRLQHFRLLRAASFFLFSDLLLPS